MMLTSADTLADQRVDIHAVGGVGEVAAFLAVHGFAVVDGLSDEGAALELAERLGRVVRHRDSKASGLTTITCRGREVSQPGQAGFTGRALAPHTDASDQATPPRLMILACAQPGQGGASLVVDGQAIHREVAATAPDALTDLSHPRSAYFGGPDGVLTSVFEAHHGGALVALRLRQDDRAQFSPRARQWLPLLRRIIDHHTITFTLSAGSAYVVNNWRWLHGRRCFTGHRLMHRVLCDPDPRWRIPGGFVPTGVAR